MRIGFWGNKDSLYKIHYLRKLYKHSSWKIILIEKVSPVFFPHLSHGGLTAFRLGYICLGKKGVFYVYMYKCLSPVNMTAWNWVDGGEMKKAKFTWWKFGKINISKRGYIRQILRAGRILWRKERPVVIVRNNQCYTGWPTCWNDHSERKGRIKWVLATFILCHVGDVNK